MRTQLCNLTLALLALAATGCTTDLTRSRDLGNPQVSGTTLAQQVCSNCHGVGGISISPNFPILAAQTPEYITTQLKEFREHHRADPAGFEYMWGLSRGLSDEQIQALAGYFSAQAPAAGRDGFSAYAQRGASIFRTGLPDRGVPACTGCHGDNAQGNGMYPRLAGQHADYLMKQLMVFQRTDQRPAGAVMKVVAHDLQPDDIRDVALFAQSLTTN